MSASHRLPLRLACILVLTMGGACASQLVAQDHGAGDLPNSVIRHVDLVHFSHTDYGFSDHPEVCREMQRRGLDIAAGRDPGHDGQVAVRKVLLDGGNHGGRQRLVARGHAGTPQGFFEGGAGGTVGDQCVAAESDGHAKPARMAGHVALASRGSLERSSPTSRSAGRRERLSACGGHGAVGPRHSLPVQRHQSS